MRTGVTITANLIGTRLLFIGAHADRIRRVRNGGYCSPVADQGGMIEYPLSDLPTLASAVVMEGWGLKIAP